MRYLTVKNLIDLFHNILGNTLNALLIKHITLIFSLEAVHIFKTAIDRNKVEKMRVFFKYIFF